MHAENPAADLPPYSLDVQAMDLGPGVKAVGLELIETESREPLRGSDAATIWAPAFVALAGKEPYVVDFFSHLERVRASRVRVGRRDLGRRSVHAVPDFHQVADGNQPDELRSGNAGSLPRAGRSYANPVNYPVYALRHIL